MSRFEQAQREQLERLKAELSARVSLTHRYLHEREHAISAKFNEQVIEMAAEELVHNLDSGGRDELRRIEKALERLSEGTYGGLYVLWGRHPRSPAGGGAICRGVHRLRRDGYGIGNLCAGRTDRRGQNVEIPVFSMNQ